MFIDVFKLVHIYKDHIYNNVIYYKMVVYFNDFYLRNVIIFKVIRNLWEKNIIKGSFMT